MKRYQQSWMRLAEAARRAPEPADDAAPYGFATRVAALGLAAQRPVASVLERLSLRAMGVACLLAALAVAANYSVIRSLFAHDTSATTADDPITDVVNLAS